MLALGLTLLAAAAAHAQTTPAGTPYPAGSSEIYPKKIKDPVQLDEAHIANSRVHTGPSERAASSSRYMGPTFKAEVVVTNHAAKTIKSVEWTATLTDPATGNVISTYDVKSNSNIAPGKTKRLSKKLRTPSARVVNATARNSDRQVGNLNVEVKSVTYADGTTSTTP
jgi:hypothetical protein